jgi:hypothetical protein
MPGRLSEECLQGEFRQEYFAEHFVAVVEAIRDEAKVPEYFA